MTEHAYVEWSIESSGVAILTLNNPPLNLNTLTTLAQLRGACEALDRDERVRAVVITGKGTKAFCAGSDLQEFASVREDVVPRKLERENEAFTAIENLPMPVIAALNGVTLGGGAEIALCCDIRIIDDAGRIGFPEVKLGVFPGSGGVFRLPRLIGAGRAYELLYTGNIIGAEQAHRIGLVNRIAPSGASMETAIALAETLAKGPALALSLIRAGVRDSFSQTTDEAIRRTLADSDRVFKASDINEGLAAFFEKRSPAFTAGRSGAAIKKG